MAVLGSWTAALALLALISSCGSVQASSEDLIQELPGAPPHSFKQYSGYVTVDKDHGRRLFYWFVEAEESPDTKPLVLWLNGGKPNLLKKADETSMKKIGHSALNCSPGCSSISGGTMTELGPFFPNQSGNGLIYNKFAWNSEASIIFLESPAGVGFSYSDTPSDYTVGDTRTAADSREFLLGWFKKFPQFTKRDFYIAGESYAGHYIPDLSYLLWQKRDEDSSLINFKGFLLGNPAVHRPADFKGMMDFWWSRSLISTHTYETFLHDCSANDYKSAKPGERCYNLTEKAHKEMGDLNMYDVYVDVCTSKKGGQESRHYMEKIGLLSTKESSLLRAPYDPCVNNEAETYLNLPHVQKALHVQKLPYKWSGCSTFLNYSIESVCTSKLWKFKELLKTPLSMTVFSGDVDGVCPTMGTRNWLAILAKDGDIVLTKKWSPWFLNQQVGGYSEEYNAGQFKFVTVRNAGHMVPYMQPARGMAVFKHYLAGESMSSSPQNHNAVV